jgi:hypothetical protein
MGNEENEEKERKRELTSWEMSGAMSGRSAGLPLRSRSTGSVRSLLLWRAVRNLATLGAVIPVYEMSRWRRVVVKSPSDTRSSACTVRVRAMLK